MKKSTTASITDSVVKLKSLFFPALVKAKSNASLNNEAIFLSLVCSKSMRREVQIARFWLNSCSFPEPRVMRSHKIRGSGDENARAQYGKLVLVVVPVLQSEGR